MAAPRPFLAATIADLATRRVRTLLDARIQPDTRTQSDTRTQPDTRTRPDTRTQPDARTAAGGIGSAERWTRANHRGEPVSLLEGPAVAAGLLAGALLGGGGPRATVAAVIATAGAAGFGLVDDLTEEPADRAKGLRGHLGALARGRLTTGALKVVGIGATAVAAAAVASPWPTAGGSRRRWALDVLASGALIAGSANLANLLDLRPGRALKAAALCAGPVALAGGRGAGLAAAVVGASAGALREDLAERDMLGDGGANAVGAMLGTAVVLDAPRPVRLAVLGAVVALTLASERVSFTAVIAGHPLLRELDEWGRRPEEGTAAHAVVAPDRPA